MHRWLSDLSQQYPNIKSKWHHSQIFMSHQIVTTRPNPTVCPPSRYMNSVFRCIFYAFYGWNLHIFAGFIWSIFICMISWHRFGTGNHTFPSLQRLNNSSSNIRLNLSTSISENVCCLFRLFSSDKSISFASGILSTQKCFNLGMGISS